MKLLVIVLCLLSERFLLHSYGNKREVIFATYIQQIRDLTIRVFKLQQPALLLTIILAPVLIILALLLGLTCHWVFGLITLLINIAVFYLCLGPVNPFYPVTNTSDDGNPLVIQKYLSEVNRQLFAVIFWYVIAGPVGVLAYRVITQMQTISPLESITQQCTAILEWLPARMTVVLYLLVGNFQQGIKRFTELCFTPISNNDQLLSECGLLAAQSKENEPVSIVSAEQSVTHAVIILLVFIACFTLGSWL